LVPAHLADALIAVAVAVIGAGGAFGARHQGGRVPVAATLILAAMGCVEGHSAPAGEPGC